MYMNVWRLSQIELIIYCSLRSHFISRKWIDSEPRNTEVKKIPSCELKTMKVYLFSNLKAFFAVSTSGTERRLKCVAEVK